MHDTNQAFELSYLAQRVGGALVNAQGLEKPITEVCASSDECRAGALFVALKGSKVDGHDYLSQAFKKGAIAALVERADSLADRPGIITANSKAALSKLAALFCGEPSKEMAVVGVTGTNGKTTTHWMVYHILSTLGQKCARIGTLGACVSGREIDTGFTTPDAIMLHKFLAAALTNEVNNLVMEVSSHALDQHRADDVAFDVGIFTNLTRDHLDYHQDMESYYAAKAKLFALLARTPGKLRQAVVNADCPYGLRLIKELTGSTLNVVSFGKSVDSDYRIDEFTFNMHESTLKLKTPAGFFTVRSKFVGEHNAQNMAGAIAACAALGADISEIVNCFAALPHVPGRLESVGKESFGVFVDYAHTPDALAKALRTLRALTKKKLWVVFGCGGDRDKGKRPQMAQVAKELADKIVVTSDNPRMEDPLQIINDILSSGIVADQTEADRRAAIRAAVIGACPGDVVLIAGKGHENYQISGATKSHFSDVEEAELAISLRGAKGG